MGDATMDALHFGSTLPQHDGNGAVSRMGGLGSADLGELLYDSSAAFRAQALGGAPGDAAASEVAAEALMPLPSSGGPRRWPSRGAGGPLASAFESKVLPRLLLAHRNRSQPSRPPQGQAGSAQAGARRPGGAGSGDSLGSDIGRLAGLAVRSDLDGAVALINALHREGAALDDLYLNLIAPAARHLGMLWHEDRMSFADVTVGVLSLTRLLHELDHAFCHDSVQRDPARRVLLVPRPGESHGFAVDMVGAFLRRAGWDVLFAAPRTDAALAALVENEWFALVGISDSCDGHAGELAATIRTLRRNSRNERLGVMVGGPVFDADPHLATQVGADATAADARQAVIQAEGLYALLKRGA